MINVIIWEMRIKFEKTPACTVLDISRINQGYFPRHIDLGSFHNSNAGATVQPRNFPDPNSPMVHGYVMAPKRAA
jgi:hypothetical protein